MAIDGPSFALSQYEKASGKKKRAAVCGIHGNGVGLPAKRPREGRAGLQKAMLVGNLREPRPPGQASNQEEWE